MNMRNWSCRVLAAIVMIVAGQAAVAEVIPQNKLGDPKLVVFPYDANNSYRILTRPRAATHIELLPEERVTIFALGDTVSWQTVEKANHVFIKPVYANQTVAGTLVTNRRTYQLLLVSGNETSHFYQHVSFQYPDLIAAENRLADVTRLAELNAGATTASRKDDETKGAAPGQMIDPSRLNFGYDSEGAASFKPLQIYDDGRSTYIRFGADVLDMPALFRVREGNAVELVEYTTQGNLLVVPKVLDAGLLKLGEAEIRFRNLSRFKKTWLGRYERVEN